MKTDGSGNVVMYIARLVARGYLQVLSIDYDETFSSVKRLETVRLVLAIVMFAYSSNGCRDRFSKRRS